ncbi:MAG TPA: serine hydrolase domain-containing protein [Actinomycetota bacterium]|nr:serine hydrolase domain-containing protein [Actinomycetota bacterium]
MTIDRTAETGLDPAGVEALLARAEEEIRDGHLPSCQVALARDGELALLVTLGHATDEHRYVIFSMTKAIVAGAMWILFGEGLLEPSTRVVDVVPGFGTNGKELVTVEHLLLHTAGFPRAPMHPLEGATREGRLERFAQWRLDWEPGTAYEYHPSSAHWVMAEVIERVTNEDFRTFVNERVISPVEPTTLRLGERGPDHGDVAVLRMTSEPLPPEDMAALGIRNADAMLGELGPTQLLRYNEPEVRAAGSPGGGAVGTAADVALFFQALLHDPAGTWDPEVLHDGTATIRNVFPDPFTGVPANRTRGLVVAGDDGRAAFRSFAHDAGPRTFGSPGAGGQVAWADPDSGLSFCYLTNGLDADVVRSARRSITLSSLAAAAAR